MSPKEFAKETVDKALVRQKTACAHCGTALAQPYYGHFKKPAELGGDTSLGNCVLLCQPCHLQYGHLGKWSKWAITQDYPYMGPSY